MGVINGITRTITMLNHLCYFNLLLNLAGRPAVLCICEVVATLIKFCKAAATRRYICGDSGSRLLMAAAAHRRFGGNKASLHYITTWQIRQNERGEAPVVVYLYLLSSPSARQNTGSSEARRQEAYLDQDPASSPRSDAGAALIYCLFTSSAGRFH